MAALGIVIIRAVMLAAIAALALANGMIVAPLFDSVAYFLLPVSKEFLVTDRMAIYHATSPFIALATLVLSAVPAALYERLRGLQRSTIVSLGLWLAAAMAMVLPGLLEITEWFAP